MIWIGKEITVGFFNVVITLRRDDHIVVTAERDDYNLGDTYFFAGP